MKIGDKVTVVQLCCFGTHDFHLLGQKGTIIDVDDTFAEGQSLVAFPDTKEIWFFNAELEKCQNQPKN